ncbi:MAG: hypothetical protein K0R08_1049 [Solimicrobium sp.]|nr:hypothetical protein [Solimicrobium sp.]
MVIKLLKNQKKPRKVNLHGLSHRLAEFYLRAVLSDFSSIKSALPQQKISYGNASHNNHDENKMKSMVQKVLLSSTNCKNGGWVPEWFEGYMTLTGSKL